MQLIKRNRSLISTVVAAMLGGTIWIGGMGIGGHAAFGQESAPATPQAGQPADAAAQGNAAAAQAWEALRNSAQGKLQGATSQAEAEAALEGVLGDLLAFADAHPKTDEAAMALLNHGALAAQLERYDAAEASLKRAKGVTDDAQLVEAIEMQLAQMSIRPGKTPPDFTATTLSGEEVSPGDYHGKVVLLDFWATWCGPCIAELPNVKRVYADHHEAGFEIVSISLDRDEQTLREFVEAQEMTWTHVYNPAQPPAQNVANKYFVSAIPTMVLIGRDGKIAGVDLRGGELEVAVKTALAAAPPKESGADEAAAEGSTQAQVETQ